MAAAVALLALLTACTSAGSSDVAGANSTEVSGGDAGGPEDGVANGQDAEGADEHDANDATNATNAPAADDDDAEEAPPTAVLGETDADEDAVTSDADVLPNVPDSREALVEAVEETVTATLDEVGGDGFAVVVTDEHGREVVAHDADKSLLPASTMKNVTAAAALTTLGPDATFTTTVEPTAPVDDAGVLDGDLLLVGSGDPVLATDEFVRWVSPQRPHTPLEALVDEVVDAGVTEITGDIVGVPEGFDGPPAAEGWPDRYFDSFDARYLSGLTVDSGLQTQVTLPPGAEAVDADEPPADGTAGSSGGASATPSGPPTVRTDHAEDPAAHTASEFARLLETHGVGVAGAAASGEYAATVGQLGAVESPPVEEILRYAIQQSDNQITDGLLLAVGRARSGVGSFDSGAQALRQVLDHYGIDHDEAAFADGSGLSRDDRLTPQLLVDLELAMYATEHAQLWPSLMAVTGESGTLSSRLAGTVADGRFAGKTGTLRDVSALTGTVSGDNGQRYHLAVIANDPGDARWISRDMANDLILQLVADLDGCAANRTGAQSTLGLQELQVEC